MPVKLWESRVLASRYRPLESGLSPEPGERCAGEDGLAHGLRARHAMEADEQRFRPLERLPGLRVRDAGDEHRRAFLLRA